MRGGKRDLNLRSRPAPPLGVLSRALVIVCVSVHLVRHAKWGKRAKGEAVAEYRWGRASGGAAPEGAPSGGHGYYCVPEGEERFPLWAIRSLPGADGSVRLGHVGGANGAVVGESE